MGNDGCCRDYRFGRRAVPVWTASATCCRGRRGGGSGSHHVITRPRKPFQDALGRCRPNRNQEGAARALRGRTSLCRGCLALAERPPTVPIRNPKQRRRFHEDGLGDETLTRAAVLVPIVRCTEAFTVLLTQRTAHRRDHASQIQLFPAGASRPAIIPGACGAARTLHEEIGLGRAANRGRRLSAAVPDQHRFSVTPVVAFVTPPFELRPDRSRSRKCSRCRRFSCWIRPTISSTNCTSGAAACGSMWRCPTATSLPSGGNCRHDRFSRAAPEPPGLTAFQQMMKAGPYRFVEGRMFVISSSLQTNSQAPRALL